MTVHLPLLEQYERIKIRHKDDIVFFRLGDFYEMFYADALEASGILGLTLTHRQEAPMCGVPHHAARSYIAKLLKAGKKVAICEQLSAPVRGARGIIERGVVEVISPGSVVDDDYLESAANNYLIALGAFGSVLALAWCDASTGEFYAESFPAADTEKLRRELYKLSAREAIVRQSMLDNAAIAEILAEYPALYLNRYPDWVFSIEEGRSALRDHFATTSLRGFGFDDADPALAAAGCLLDYLKDSLKMPLDHFRTLKRVADESYVLMDEATQKNLELVSNLRDGGKTLSLLSVLDYTKTAMGARALRARILHPLRSLRAIEDRLDAVDFLYKNQRTLESIRDSLSACRDIERLTSRLSIGRAGPRDIAALKDSADLYLALAEKLPHDVPAALSLYAGGQAATEVREFVAELCRALEDDPAFSPLEGNVIRGGWNAELDALRVLRSDTHAVLNNYLEEERRVSGLSGLKIKYNRILGYYLELPKGAAQSAPSHFIRRQTLTTGERYVTERLAELDAEIEGAAEKILNLEQELFAALKEALKRFCPALFEAAQKLAEVDCAAALAWAATVRAYRRPSLDDSTELFITEGRHPVVEAWLPSGDFVPNSVRLDGAGEAFALITGPNMAGKSTFLRQNALIVLLAQMGSFVPAAEAHIGLADRIFCRVGAQDNLARGESTFLLEMHETAVILNNAGAKSLIIMDEVGRGTGTQDGLAIARAVSEYILDVCKSRTFFATHYHELTALKHERLVDLSMAVEERAGDIVFLKRVVPGAAAGSYGIHVARLAGVPLAVTERADKIQRELASGEIVRAAPAPKTSAEAQASLSALFSIGDVVARELRHLDVDRMTPLEALAKLAHMQKAVLSAGEE